MLVGAADAMFFCGLETMTTYSRACDDLIHRPASIPEGQSSSARDNKTQLHV